MNYNSGGHMGYHSASPMPSSAAMLMQQQPTQSRGMPQHQQQHQPQYQPQYQPQQQQYQQHQPQYQQMQGPTSLSYGGSSFTNSGINTGPMGQGAAMNSQSGMMGHSGMMSYGQQPLGKNAGGGVASQGVLNIAPTKRGGH